MPRNTFILVVLLAIFAFFVSLANLLPKNSENATQRPIIPEPTITRSISPNASPSSTLK